MTKINFETANVNFEQLGSTDPIAETFESLNPEFTDYYQIQSQYDLQEWLARTYLLKVDEKAVGFISITMAHLRKEITEKTQTKESDVHFLHYWSVIYLHIKNIPEKRLVLN